jgi:hypothetical protein
MTTKQLFTREDRLNNKCSHREYYGQFVSNYTLRRVGERFGLDRLVKAYHEDKSFNTIPLKEWDMIAIMLEIPMEDCGDTLTLSGAVCIAKEAARLLVERFLLSCN